MKLRTTICSVVSLALTASLAWGQQPKPTESAVPLPLLPVDVTWRISLDAAPAAAASLDAAHVYVALESGAVVALRRDTGATAWRRDLRTRWPVVIAPTGLIVASESELALLDPESGATRWSWPLTRKLLVAPAVDASRVIAILEQGDVTAVRLADGHEQWQVRIPNDSPIFPPLMGEPGVMHIALENGDMVALFTETGQPAWRRHISTGLGPPAWADDRVLVGSVNNTFYALDAWSGNEVWRWKAGGDIVGASADARRVYFAALDNLLRAVNRGNGNQVWRSEIATRPAAPPNVFGNIVLVSSASTMMAYASETGALVSSHDVEGQLQGVPLVDAALRPFTPAVFVLTRDGRLTGLTPVASLFREPAARPLDALPGTLLGAEALD